MVLKSAFNRLLKTEPKPPQFPKGSKFSKTEAKSLLEEAQSKVQEIESSKSKIKSQNAIMTHKYIKYNDEYYLND